MVLGGIGDLLLASPPDLWSHHLGQPVGSLSPGVARLLMCLLHALGSALVASGIATLFLISGPLRRGDRFAGLAITMVVVLSDGVNAFQIRQLGAFYEWNKPIQVGRLLHQHLDVAARIPGADQAVFADVPDAAKTGRPISRL